MLEEYVVCKTEYSKLGNMKVKIVPYKLPLGKRCAAGLVNSNCAIPVILKCLPASGFDMDDMGNKDYGLKGSNYMNP